MAVDENQRPPSPATAERIRILKEERDRLEQEARAVDAEHARVLADKERMRLELERQRERYLVQKAKLEDAKARAAKKK